MIMLRITALLRVFMVLSSSSVDDIILVTLGDATTITEADLQPTAGLSALRQEAETTATEVTRSK
jgi:hypothetical protein